MNPANQNRNPNRSTTTCVTEEEDSSLEDEEDEEETVLASVTDGGDGRNTVVPFAAGTTKGTKKPLSLTPLNTAHPPPAAFVNKNTWGNRQAQKAQGRPTAMMNTRPMQKTPGAMASLYTPTDAGQDAPIIPNYDHAEQVAQKSLKRFGKWVDSTAEFIPLTQQQEALLGEDDLPGQNLRIPDESEIS